MDLCVSLLSLWQAVCAGNGKNVISVNRCSCSVNMAHTGSRIVVWHRDCFPRALGSRPCCQQSFMRVGTILLGGASEWR